MHISTNGILAEGIPSLQSKILERDPSVTFSGSFRSIAPSGLLLSVAFSSPLSSIISSSPPFSIILSYPSPSFTFSGPSLTVLGVELRQDTQGKSNSFMKYTVLTKTSE